MNNLRNDLILAFKQANFLQVVYEKSLSERDSGNDITEELVRMNNEGLIDVIAGFRALRNRLDAGCDFFMTRHILERVLPHLNAPVLPVMDCVLHLVKEAGQDMAAGTLFTPYIDFCSAEASRPREALKQIEAAVDQLANLLVPTIIAGARIKTKHYRDEAIRLSGHQNIEIRKRAVFSLGEIQYPEDAHLSEPALECLELICSKETDDSLMGNLINSAFNLIKNDSSQKERIIDLINLALSKGGDYALHAASKLLCFDFDELPETLLNVLLDHLQRVKHENKGTFDNIDHGLVNLLSLEDPSKGIEWLEAVLLANPNGLSMNIFDRVTRKITKNRKLLNKLVTRWFIRSDRVLCEGIHSIVNKAYDQDILVEIDPDELVSVDPVHIVFLARKSIGYLFIKPVTAASIIISLTHHADDDTRKQLGDLLFDPLLLNYPGQVRDYLLKQTANESVQKKLVIDAVLKAFDNYLSDLKSTGEVPELHPSQEQREAYQRHFSRLMSESFKDAEKESVLANLFSKSVLLYGRKSINYVYGPDGQANRMEIPLHKHETEMEFPRLDYIDPFGLDYMLRIFRAERIKS